MNNAILKFPLRSSRKKLFCNLNLINDYISANGASVSLMQSIFDSNTIQKERSVCSWQVIPFIRSVPHFKYKLDKLNTISLSVDRSIITSQYKKLKYSLKIEYEINALIEENKLNDAYRLLEKSVNQGIVCSFSSLAKFAKETCLHGNVKQIKYLANIAKSIDFNKFNNYMQFNHFLATALFYDKRHIESVLLFSKLLKHNTSSKEHRKLVNNFKLIIYKVPDIDNRRLDYEVCTLFC